MTAEARSTIGAVRIHHRSSAALVGDSFGSSPVPLATPTRFAIIPWGVLVKHPSHRGDLA